MVLLRDGLESTPPLVLAAPYSFVRGRIGEYPPLVLAVLYSFVRGRIGEYPPLVLVASMVSWMPEGFSMVLGSLCTRHSNSVN